MQLLICCVVLCGFDPRFIRSHSASVTAKGPETIQHITYTGGEGILSELLTDHPRQCVPVALSDCIDQSLLDALYLEQQVLPLRIGQRGEQVVLAVPERRQRFALNVIHQASEHLFVEVDTHKPISPLPQPTAHNRLTSKNSFSHELLQYARFTLTSCSINTVLM